MNEYSNRHQLLNDPIFWPKLAYTACGWLRHADDQSLGRFWVDDFLPERAIDTKHGVDIEGTAWVGHGPRVQHPYRIIVTIPQKMLHHPERTLSIEQFHLDEAQRILRVRIAPA